MMRGGEGTGGGLGMQARVWGGWVRRNRKAYRGGGGLVAALRLAEEEGAGHTTHSVNEEEEGDANQSIRLTVQEGEEAMVRDGVSSLADVVGPG
uniref:Uncharacterized protein n=1 Tax=Oryza brachyantha TaxID=4533 RepID=J3LBM8_ORYBR